MTSYLSVFTNQMEEFASELNNMFPEDVDRSLIILDSLEEF